MLSILKKYLTAPATTESVREITTSAESERIVVPAIVSSECNGCRACAEVCPTRAIVFHETAGSSTLLIRGELCIRCGRCMEDCPKGALSYGFSLPVAARDKNAFHQTYSGEGGRYAPAMQKAAAINDPVDEKTLRKLLHHSLHFRELDSGSCNACEVEVNMLTSTYYDVERFGISSTASPRFADALLITGPVTRNMKEACERTWQAIPTPKIVIAMGSCAISGGIYRGSYAVHDGAESVLPVDVFIPGCPPSPQALIYGLLLAMR